MRGASGISRNLFSKFESSNRANRKLQKLYQSNGLLGNGLAQMREFAVQVLPGGNDELLALVRC